MDITAFIQDIPAKLAAMDINTIILNMSYILIVIGLLVRDILVLRSIIILGEIGFVIYGATFSMTILVWNAIFMVINSIQVVRLIRERRPVPIPEELRDIYENIFPELTTREFIYFWNMGKNINITNDYLCRDNEVQKELILIVNGTVHVKKGEELLAELKRGSFIAEMSFLTGEPASADVLSTGSVECVCWSQQKIHDLYHINRNLLMKIQVILGQDLSHKLKKYSILHLNS